MIKFNLEGDKVDGKVYFSSEDGEVFGVKAGPKYEPMSANPMGEVLMATPAISNGMIFVRGPRHLFVGGSQSDKSNSTK
jgi:hypothetical protein